MAWWFDRIFPSFSKKKGLLLLSKGFVSIKFQSARKPWTDLLSIFITPPKKGNNQNYDVINRYYGSEIKLYDNGIQIYDTITRILMVSVHRYSLGQVCKINGELLKIIKKKSIIHRLVNIHQPTVKAPWIDAYYAKLLICIPPKHNKL